MKWRASRHLRLMRYVSISKLERLEGDLTTLGSTSFSILGFGFSFSINKSPGIQSRVERVEKILRRQKLLGELSKPGPYQFLIAEVEADEFVAQGVAVWVAKLENGYMVAGGSATYLDRNIDVFTSKGIIPGSNPNSYFAGLAAIYRQAINRAGENIVIPRTSMESWPTNAEDGSYHSENDSHQPVVSKIWRIKPMDAVIATNLDREQIFIEADVIDRLAGGPWRGKVRLLLLVHTDHTFENDRLNTGITPGDRLIVGSPLYVEQLTPTGARSSDLRK